MQWISNTLRHPRSWLLTAVLIALTVSGSGAQAAMCRCAARCR